MVSLWSSFLLLIVLGAALHLIKERKTLTRVRALEIVLLWMIVIGFGVSGIVASMGHIFNADAVAASIGWPAGNPFQQEVGYADLALGCLGIGALFVRGSFWLATIIAANIMYIGDGIGHIDQAAAFNNLAPNNTGMVISNDIGLPLLVVVLYIVFIHLQRQSGAVSA